MPNLLKLSKFVLKFTSDFLWMQIFRLYNLIFPQKHFLILRLGDKIKYHNVFLSSSSTYFWANNIWMTIDVPDVHKEISDQHWAVMWRQWLTLLPSSSLHDESADICVESLGATPLCDSDDVLVSQRWGGARMEVSSSPLRTLDIPSSWSRTSGTSATPTSLTELSHPAAGR